MNVIAVCDGGRYIKHAQNVWPRGLDYFIVLVGSPSPPPPPPLVLKPSCLQTCRPSEGERLS